MAHPTEDELDDPEPIPAVLRRVEHGPDGLSLTEAGSMHIAGNGVEFILVGVSARLEVEEAQPVPRDGPIANPEVA